MSYTLAAAGALPAAGSNQRPQHLFRAGEEGPNETPPVAPNTDHGHLALVLAALAWALLWTGLPAPAAAQSSETGVSSVTVDGTRSFAFTSID